MCVSVCVCVELPGENGKAVHFYNRKGAMCEFFKDPLSQDRC